MTLVVADKPDVAALDVRRRAFNLFLITHGHQRSTNTVNDSHGDLATDGDYFTGTSITRFCTVNRSRMLGVKPVKIIN